MTANVPKRPWGLRRRMAACVAVMLTCVSAHSWDDHGHRVVAIAALEQLMASERGTLVALLEAHPRFEDDLARHARPGLDPRERRRALIAAAANWPDAVKRFEHVPSAMREALVARYNRGWWHFINLPVYSTGEGSWAPEPRPENVVAALVANAAALSAADTHPGDRGVALAWLLHLVADVHQPLHAVALFDRQQFPKGDRGGNDIAVGADSNLHAFWDGVVDEHNTPDVAELTATVEVALDFRPQRWAEESRRYARRHVYTEALLRRPGRGPVQLADDYVAAARVVALERMRHAAARLAQALRAVAAANATASAPALDEVR